MDPNHASSDIQSLRLTRAAIDALCRRPALQREVLATLDHWDRVAPADSKPLRDTWRSILADRAWGRALDPGPLGQQLRQASPLGRALNPALRLEIIRACKGLSSNT